jgi:hypothetical protein
MYRPAFTSLEATGKFLPGSSFEIETKNTINTINTRQTSGKHIINTNSNSRSGSQEGSGVKLDGNFVPSFA